MINKDTYKNRLTNRDTNKVCFDTWELCGLDYVCKRDCRKPTPCKIPAIIKRLAAFEDLIENGSVIMTAAERDEEIDAVRKETAKEILNMLYDMGIDKEILECCRIYDVNGVSLAKQICEKYGVEIEK